MVVIHGGSPDLQCPNLRHQHTSSIHVTTIDMLYNHIQWLQDLNLLMSGAKGQLLSQEWKKK